MEVTNEQLELLCNMMDGLGQTADKIAESLASDGIKGMRMGSGPSPICMKCTKFLNVRCSCAERHMHIYGPGNRCHASVKMDAAIVRFLRLFNQGWYPQVDLGKNPLITCDELDLCDEGGTTTGIDGLLHLTKGLCVSRSFSARLSVNARKMGWWSNDKMHLVLDPESYPVIAYELPTTRNIILSYNNFRLADYDPEFWVLSRLNSTPKGREYLRLCNKEDLFPEDACADIHECRRENGLAHARTFGGQEKMVTVASVQAASKKVGQKVDCAPEGYRRIMLRLSDLEVLPIEPHKHGDK